MDIIDALTQIEIVGNKLWRIVGLFGIILLAFLVGKIIKIFLQKSIPKAESQGQLVLAAALNAIARSSVFFFAVLGISIGLGVLNSTPKVSEVVGTISAILLATAIGSLVFWLVDVPVTWFNKISTKTESKLDDMLVPIIRKSLRITVVILVLVQIIQIISDKPLTSIIAGLGIGGLAVALAAQDSLKNIFGSLVLFVDKPFEFGDRIVVDGHDGPVEEVGLRSTRIRTLDGHLVTIPNGELANKTIKNIGKRPYIKRIADITITYDTPPEKLDRALEILRSLLENHEGMNGDFPPRVFFNDFNAASLNLRVMYWYHPPDYWAYMGFAERFNKEVFRLFNEEGIDFAFPTQTLYLAGDASRPLSLGVGRDSVNVDT